MDADNVISMVDDFNLAATVKEIKDFERLLNETRAVSKWLQRWEYLMVDNIHGRYISTFDGKHHLLPMGNSFLKDLKLDRISFYDLNEAKALCELENEKISASKTSNVHFVPILWRRFCIIHLASLYDVIQKMDAKGKTKRFFSSC